MTGFLDLPPELRLIIYDYVLPTRMKPQTLCFNPKLDSQQQPFLSLWNICNQITSEIPEVETLVASGALLPTLNVEIKFITEGCPWERGLEKLLPYLKSASSFYIRGPAYLKEGKERGDHGYDCKGDRDAITAWWAWLKRVWSRSTLAHEALHMWLSGAENTSRHFASKSLRLHVGHVDHPTYSGMIPSLLLALKRCCIRNLSWVYLEDLNWPMDYMSIYENEEKFSGLLIELGDILDDLQEPEFESLRIAYDPDSEKFIGILDSNSHQELAQLQELHKYRQFWSDHDYCFRMYDEARPTEYLQDEKIIEAY